MSDHKPDCDSLDIGRNPDGIEKPCNCGASLAALRSGWWWTRPASDCLWRLVEITIGDDWKVMIQEMGDESPGILPNVPWWQWAGPIVPPKSDETKTAAPKWYTAEELWHHLRRLNYPDEIADNISVEYAASLQRAFNKGYEIGWSADRPLAAAELAPEINDSGEDYTQPSLEELEKTRQRHPTVEELDRILTSPEPLDIQVQPDGSIRAVPKAICQP